MRALWVQAYNWGQPHRSVCTCRLRSCDRVRWCSYPCNCRRMRKCGWYSPLPCRSAQLRLRYDDGLLPQSLYKLSSCSVSKYHMPPSPFLCKWPPLQHGKRYRDQGHLHPSFLLHCSVCRFWSPFPFRCRWAGSLPSTLRSYVREAVHKLGQLFRRLYTHRLHMHEHALHKGFHSQCQHRSNTRS
ncbi:unknown [Firmicutes bacterium CAG:555]|nr:unknown [Firmicutes bacterium CAG:555]